MTRLPSAWPNDFTWPAIGDRRCSDSCGVSVLVRTSLEFFSKQRRLRCRTLPTACLQAFCLLQASGSSYMPSFATCRSILPGGRRKDDAGALHQVRKGILMADGNNLDWRALP